MGSEINSSPCREEGNAVMFIKNNTHLPSLVSLGRVVEDLEPIVANLIRIYQAMIEIVAKVQDLIHDEDVALARHPITPCRSNSGDWDLVHSAELVVESTHCTFLPSVVDQAAVDASTYCVSLRV